MYFTGVSGFCKSNFKKTYFLLCSREGRFSPGLGSNLSEMDTLTRMKDLGVYPNISSRFSNDRQLAG